MTKDDPIAKPPNPAGRAAPKTHRMPPDLRPTFAFEHVGRHELGRFLKS
jgi:hypothetical protein